MTRGLKLGADGLYPGLTAVVITASDQALRAAGIDRDQIAGAGFGIGGYDWPSPRAITLRALELLGLAAPVEIVNDTLLCRSIRTNFFKDKTL